MMRKGAVLLLAAVGFGVASLLIRQIAGPPEPMQGSVEAVQVGRLWKTELPDLAGRNRPLSEWQGKVVVLNFWATWCPPCRQEIPGFVSLQERYAGQGLQFVGIALDKEAAVRGFVQSYGINYPILLGGLSGAMLGEAAGNRMGGLPYTLVLDRLGNPVASLTGGIDEARLESILKPLL